MAKQLVAIAEAPELPSAVIVSASEGTLGLFLATVGKFSLRVNARGQAYDRASSSHQLR